MAPPTSPARTWAMEEFRAMGSRCRIVAPTPSLAQTGRDLVDDLERRWSRFRPDSEISVLNRSAGHLTLVSEPTFTLLERAQQARELTGGRFNPLGLDRLERLGYDRSHDTVLDDARPVGDAADPLPDDDIECFPELHAVRLPAGARFDPGGLGKGLAADLVASELLARGAETVQVELGGDVHVAGPSWSGGPWRVEVDLLHRDSSVAHGFELEAGGVATSGVTRRTWTRAGQALHHLLDPATGRCATTDLVSVSVAAASTWWAEVVAKVAVIAGSAGAESTLRRHAVSGVILPGHGDPVVVGTDRPNLDEGIC